MMHRSLFQQRHVRVLVLSYLLIGLVFPMASTSAEDLTVGSEVVILDTYSYWRCYVTLRPAVFGTAKEAQPDPNAIPSIRRRDAAGNKISIPKMPPDQPRSPLPSADWRNADFDDTAWWRDPGPFFGGGPAVGNKWWDPSPHQSRYGYYQPREVALLCLRGKFTVTDPRQVKTLTLSAEFRGGLVVYLNGKEVARRHLPVGRIDPETLAEDYPLEAFADATGKLFGHPSRGVSAHHYQLRIRKVEGLTLPVRELRQGTNVLTLEVHRTAIPPGMWSKREPTLSWNTVALMYLELSAAGGGILPNVSRPAGVQVWNVNPVESVFDTDYGEPHEMLRPIRIVAARNGSFSGQVVVSSDRPIRGLQAEMSQLRLEGGSAVLSDVHLRYPRPTERERAAKTVLASSRSDPSRRFDVLLDSPPAEVPVKEGSKGTVSACGAVQLIWVTVRVSPDASPGEYQGTLTIRLDDAGPLEVPVELKVSDFRLPDPVGWRTWADFIQSPESLALYYQVSLWSEEHFRLIGKTFEYLAQVGNKTLYIPLITRTNHGNEQSMVRWVREPDGTYTHDFTPLERYLDLAERSGLKPQMVCFQVWDYHTGGTANVWYERWGAGGYNSRAPKELVKVPVSVLDPATGALAELLLPAYGTSEARALWAPVAEELLGRMRRRGLEEAVMLGISADQPQNKQVVLFWRELLPMVKCVTMAHHSRTLLQGAPVGYATTVYDAHFGLDPDIERTYGWKRSWKTAYFPRVKEGLPPVWHRMVFEWAIQGDQRGVGRLAADFFPIKQGGRGEGRSISRRYPESSWLNLNLRAPWLAPGPDGAIPTVRFEVAREGMQECEARIFIETALTDGTLHTRLGEALVQKCQALLDVRTRLNTWTNETTNNGRYFTILTAGALGFDWYAGGSRWQQRSDRLYSAAAKVAKALGK